MKHTPQSSRENLPFPSRENLPFPGLSLLRLERPHRFPWQGENLQMNERNEKIPFLALSSMHSFTHEEAPLCEHHKIPIISPEHLKHISGSIGKQNMRL